MSISLILGILQFIGALPEIIAALKRVWELIKGIRDRKQRAALRREAVKMVLRHQKTAQHSGTQKMSADQQDEFITEVNELEGRVQAILENQGVG